MVLGKVPVLGHHTLWMIVGHLGPAVLAVGVGEGCLDLLFSSIFSLPFIPLFGRWPNID